MDLEISRLNLTMFWREIMSKNSVPKIRFKNFEKKWMSYLLSEYSTYRRGSFPQPYGNKEWYDGDNSMPFVQVVDVLENLRLIDDTKQKISTLAQPMSVFVPSDSVIVTLQGSIGRVAITQYDAYVDRTILIFEDYNSQTNKEFWAYTIRNKFEIERQKAPGGTIKTITKEALSDFKVSIPEYTEQSDIGSLFRTLDDLLSSYKDNLTNYQSLKETMLSNMFPKVGQTVPEIRLNGFEGEWVEKRLKDISKRVTRKNNDLVSERALTISAQFGLIDQEEFFQKKIASKDVSGYYLIKKGEFAYNKSYSTGYPLGAIKRLDKYENGVLSTLYILFKAVDIDSDYLAHYYESDKWHREVSMCAAEGARNHGLLNIAPADFFNTRLVIPKELAEQQAIGAYFSNLDNLINSHQEKITQLETLKKKLLQDMFI